MKRQVESVELMFLNQIKWTDHLDAWFSLKMFSVLHQWSRSISGTSDLAL